MNLLLRVLTNRLCLISWLGSFLPMNACYCVSQKTTTTSHKTVKKKYVFKYPQSSKAEIGVIALLYLDT